METSVVKKCSLLKLSIKQMSVPGTWCDHLIIQAVANAFNYVIHITEYNANSLQATIITTHNIKYNTQYLLGT